MEPLFIPTPNGQLVNALPVRHKWSKKTFHPYTCYIEPGEEKDFEAAVEE